MKKPLFCIMLVFGLTFGEMADQSFLSIKESQFVNPDMAVTEFVNGLKNSSLEQMFSTCAFNEMSELYDFRKFSLRLNAFSPQTWKAPSINSMYIGLNKIDAMNSMARQIKILTYSLLFDADFDLSIKAPFDEEEIQKTLNELNVDRLKNIEYVRSDFSVKRFEKNERYLKNSKDQAAPLGAEDSTERLVLIKFENSYYTFGIHLLKYNGFWKIDILSSPLVGTDISGKVSKTTLDEYNNIINSE
jgi:hypothetical protein